MSAEVEKMMKAILLDGDTDVDSDNELNFNEPQKISPQLEEGEDDIVPGRVRITGAVDQLNRAQAASLYRLIERLAPTIQPLPSISTPCRVCFCATPNATLTLPEAVTLLNSIDILFFTAPSSRLALLEPLFYNVWPNATLIPHRPRCIAPPLWNELTSLYNMALMDASIALDIYSFTNADDGISELVNLPCTKNTLSAPRMLYPRFCALVWSIICAIPIPMPKVMPVDDDVRPLRLAEKHEVTKGLMWASYRILKHSSPVMKSLYGYITASPAAKMACKKCVNVRKVWDTVLAKVHKVGLPVGSTIQFFNVRDSTPNATPERKSFKKSGLVSVGRTGILPSYDQIVGERSVPPRDFCGILIRPKPPSFSNSSNPPTKYIHTLQKDVGCPVIFPTETLAHKYTSNVLARANDQKQKFAGLRTILKNMNSYEEDTLLQMLDNTLASQCHIEVGRATVENVKANRDRKGKGRASGLISTLKPSGGSSGLNTPIIPTVPTSSTPLSAKSNTMTPTTINKSRVKAKTTVSPPSLKAQEQLQRVAGMMVEAEVWAIAEMEEAKKNGLDVENLVAVGPVDETEEDRRDRIEELERAKMELERLKGRGGTVKAKKRKNGKGGRK